MDNALEYYRERVERRRKVLAWMDLVGKDGHARGEVIAAAITLHYQRSAGDTNYHECPEGTHMPELKEALNQHWPLLRMHMMTKLDRDVAKYREAAAAEWKELFGEETT